MNTGVRILGIAKRFGATIALDRVDFDAEAGRITAITGPNGAGKTTVLRVLATLIRPDTGSVWVDGVDAIAEPETVRRRIGVALVNERALYWRLDGRANLRFFGTVGGLRGKPLARSIDESAAAVGATALLGKRVSTCSAGQRQRLILARALLGSPRVLLLDEPMRGLDDDGMELVRTALRGAAAAGATVVIASPSVVDEPVYDDVVHLRAGAIEARARATAGER